MREIPLFIVICMTLVPCLSGCMTQMSGIAPSSCPITSEDTYTVIGTVESSSGGFMPLGVVPIGESRPAEKCVARALEKSGGDALIEVTMDNTLMMLPYIYPYWTHLKATAVKVERGGAKN